MLSLRLFGGAFLQDANGPVTGAVAQRRRLALLALLAGSRAGLLSREKLATYLWPDADLPAARRHLSDAVHVLRRTLGHSALVAVGDELRLDPALVPSDVTDFRSHLAAGRLEAAVALYCGPFLDGFFVPGAAEFERWVDEERGRLAVECARALETLASRLAAAGDSWGAVEWWDRLVAHDPYSSRAVLGLMRALVETGSRGDALHRARAHQERLRSELEIGPDASVAAFTERLRAAEAVPRPSSDYRVGPDHRAAAPPGPRPPGPRAGGRNSQMPWGRRSGDRRALARAAAGRVLAVALLLGLVPAMWAFWPAGKAAPAPGPALAGGSPPSLAGTSNPQAHILYLRGRVAGSQRSRDGLENALALFRAATELDPRYADAYGGLADAYVLLGYLGLSPGEATFPKGKAAALRGLALDPANARSLGALGFALAWERDWSGALEAGRRAVAAEPSYATAHQQYALLLAMTGSLDAALSHSGRATELDPLSLQISNTHGTLLHYAGRLSEALDWFEQVVPAEPDTAWVGRNPWLVSDYARVLGETDHPERALVLLESVHQERPGHPRILLEMAAAHIHSGRPEVARRSFARADTADASYAPCRGMLHVLLGQLDEAFLWFDRAGAWPLALVSGLASDRRMAPVRNDPRYRTLLERLGMQTPEAPE